jgi:hypothetical protein
MARIIEIIEQVARSEDFTEQTLLRDIEAVYDELSEAGEPDLARITQLYKDLREQFASSRINHEVFTHLAAILLGMRQDLDPRVRRAAKHTKSYLQALQNFLAQRSTVAKSPIYVEAYNELGGNKPSRSAIGRELRAANLFPDLNFPTILLDELGKRGSFKLIQKEQEQAFGQLESADYTIELRAIINLVKLSDQAYFILINKLNRFLGDENTFWTPEPEDFWSTFFYEAGDVKRLTDLGTDALLGWGARLYDMAKVLTEQTYTQVPYTQVWRIVDFLTSIFTPLANSWQPDETEDRIHPALAQIPEYRIEILLALANTNFEEAEALVMDAYEILLEAENVMARNLVPVRVKGWLNKKMLQASVGEAKQAAEENSAPAVPRKRSKLRMRNLQRTSLETAAEPQPERAPSKPAKTEVPLSAQDREYLKLADWINKVRRDEELLLKEWWAAEYTWFAFKYSFGVDVPDLAGVGFLDALIKLVDDKFDSQSFAPDTVSEYYSAYSEIFDKLRQILEQTDHQSIRARILESKPAQSNAKAFSVSGLKSLGEKLIQHFEDLLETEVYTQVAKIAQGKLLALGLKDGDEFQIMEGSWTPTELNYELLLLARLLSDPTRRQITHLDHVFTANFIPTAEKIAQLLEKGKYPLKGVMIMFLEKVQFRKSLDVTERAFAAAGEENAELVKLLLILGEKAHGNSRAENAAVVMRKVWQIDKWQDFGDAAEMIKQVSQAEDPVAAFEQFLEPAAGEGIADHYGRVSKLFDAIGKVLEKRSYAQLKVQLNEWRKEFFEKEVRVSQITPHSIKAQGEELARMYRKPLEKSVHQAVSALIESKVAAAGLEPYDLFTIKLDAPEAVKKYMINRIDTFFKCWHWTIAHGTLRLGTSANYEVDLKALNFQERVSMLESVELVKITPARFDPATISTEGLGSEQARLALLEATAKAIEVKLADDLGDDRAKQWERQLIQTIVLEVLANYILPGLPDARKELGFTLSTLSDEMTGSTPGWLLMRERVSTSREFGDKSAAEVPQISPSRGVLMVNEITRLPAFVEMMTQLRENYPAIAEKVQQFIDWRQVEFEKEYRKRLFSGLYRMVKFIQKGINVFTENSRNPLPQKFKAVLGLGLATPKAITEKIFASYESTDELDSLHEYLLSQIYWVRHNLSSEQ